MRFFVIVLVFLVFGFWFVNFSLGGEVWEVVKGIVESNIKEVVVDPYKEGIIYASSEKTLYRSEDGGEIWRVVFSTKGNSDINFISVSEEGVFACTEKGVFKSVDGKSKWKRIFKGAGQETNNALHIAFSKSSKIYLGTKGGLFVSEDSAGKTWLRSFGEAGNMRVQWISFLEDDIFIATEKGVYKSSNSEWERVFVTSTEEDEYDSDEADEAISAEKPVNSIIINEGRVFLASESGIFVSGDRGHNWERFVSAGLMSQGVKRLVFNKGTLWTGTDKGIFILKNNDNLWRALYKGMSTEKTQSLSIDSKENLWAGTQKGLYKASIKDVFLFARDEDSLEAEEGLLKRFRYEPGIREVQEIAIKYAEVHPDKINKWRESVSKKAWLPTLSVGLDDSVSDYYNVQGGGTANPERDRIYKEDDKTVGWDISLSWDFGDIVWNDDQTSIDVRSKLMVQLRSDILDEITRTYFERRRLQVEVCLSERVDLKEKVEKELRIQELTANLDALTGGFFSEQLKVKR